MEDLEDLKFIEQHLEKLMFVAKIPEFDIDINTLDVTKLMLINIIGEILYNQERKSLYTINILDKLILREANIRWWIEWRIHKNEENYKLLDNYCIYDMRKEFKNWIILQYESMNHINLIPNR